MRYYPTGYSGEEGRDEETYLYFIQGEIEIKGEGLTEEEAVEEVRSMTIREALDKGLFIELN